MNWAFLRGGDGSVRGAWVPALVSAALLIAPAVLSAQSGKKPIASESANQNSGLSGELLYQILLGELNLRQGDPGLGFSLLLDAARKSGDVQLFSRTVDIALQARSGDGALAAAKAWSQAYPQDRQANNQWLQILIVLGKVEESLEPLKKEIALAPEAERSGIINLIPRQYARIGNKKLAADTVQEALEPYLRQPNTGAAAWTTVGRMRLAHDDTTTALNAVRQGVALDAQALGPALLALELMSRKVEGAETIVQQALSRVNQPDLAMGYVRVLIEQQRFDEAQQQLMSITRQYPQLAEAWLVLGSMQFEMGQEQQAEASLARYVELAEKTPNPNTSRGLAQAQTRRAELLARHGKIDEARGLIARLPSTSQEEQRVRLLAEVQLLRDHRQWQAAFELLAKHSAGDTDLMYEQAMLAEKLDRYDEMERLLRQIIAKAPDYHNAYNALGFSLADRNVRLNEAKQLIVKALSLSPEDPFITDSLGWVEFRLGNLAAALLHLQKAYTARPDAEIAAHLGEVLWRLNRQDEARRIWREGMKLTPTNETLLDTLRRLQPTL